MICLNADFQACVADVKLFLVYQVVCQCDAQPESADTQELAKPQPTQGHSSQSEFCFFCML